MELGTLLFYYLTTYCVFFRVAKTFHTVRFLKLIDILCELFLCVLGRCSGEDGCDEPWRGVRLVGL